MSQPTARWIAPLLRESAELIFPFCCAISSPSRVISTKPTPVFDRPPLSTLLRGTIVNTRVGPNIVGKNG